MKKNTPKEIYEMTHESSTHKLDHLAGCYYNHIEECELLHDGELYEIDTDRIEIRFIMDFSYDGRRVWQLATVWLDGEPVMITQNAGREGDDFSQRFITDQGLFFSMCDHIRSLISEKNKKLLEDLYEMDEEISGLTFFYNQSLGEGFTHY